MMVYMSEKLFTFTKKKMFFSSSSMNDGEFINHKYIKDYDKNKESSYRKYWDVNNSYEWDEKWKFVSFIKEFIKKYHIFNFND